MFEDSIKNFQVFFEFIEGFIAEIHLQFDGQLRIWLKKSKTKYLIEKNGEYGAGIN